MPSGPGFFRPNDLFYVGVFLNLDRSFGLLSSFLLCIRFSLFTISLRVVVADRSRDF